MIKDNRIFLGFGDIGVGYDFNTLIINEIRPPQQVGGSYSPSDNIEHFKTIKIQISSNEEYDKLFEELDSIHNKENKEIIFKDYILDFNNYNKLSVEVFIKMLNKIQFYNILAFAC